MVSVVERAVDAKIDGIEVITSASVVINPANHYDALGNVV